MAAIIFDFDGTIADSFEAVLKTFYELNGNRQPLPPDEIERLRGMSLVQAAKELNIQPWKMPFIVVRGRRRLSHQINKIKAHDGIQAIILKLYDEGHQLFIISSNSTRNIRLFLRQHSMEGEFVDVVGNVGLLSKARILKKVLRRYSLDTQTTWYVGDEVRDIVSARQAGLRVVAVSWGYNTADILAKHRPTHLINTPAELMSILENI